MGEQAWIKFQNDFDAMSDEQIADVTRTEQAKMEEAEEWLEAVAAWEAAGSPRSSEQDGESYVAFCQAAGVRP